MIQLRNENYYIVKRNIEFLKLFASSYLNLNLNLNNLKTKFIYFILCLHR